MGHSSIYCAISKLPITSGNMVMIPIVKTNQREGSRYGFAGFPIFGTYNTYSSMEQIERTPYVIELEEYFELSIDEIVKTIMWANTWHKIDTKGNPKLEELSNLDYFPIDREVWDKLVMGFEFDKYDKPIMHKPSVMKYLGFTETKIGKTLEFTHPNSKHTFISGWEGELKIKDGGNKQIVFSNINHNWEESITKYYDIPEDKQWILNGDIFEVMKLMDDREFYQYCNWIIKHIPTAPPKPHYDENGNKIDATEFLSQAITEMGKLDKNSPTYQQDFEELSTKIENILDRKPEDNMLNIYTNNVEKYKNEVLFLLRLFSLMRVYSTSLEPINTYMVAQDGELSQCTKAISQIYDIAKARLKKYEED